MQDRIEKTIDLKAPVSRVWRALTDYREFGEWFQVNLEGPFVVGELSLGWMTYPGCEHIRWNVRVTAMEPERLFAFSGCPVGGDDDSQYEEEPQTLVEFRLEPTTEGTRLYICESGFASLPDDPRWADAFRRNTEGWDIQAKNIAAYVES